MGCLLENLDVGRYNQVQPKKFPGSWEVVPLPNIIIIRVIEDSTQSQKHLFLKMENKPPGRKTPSSNIYLANIYWVLHLNVLYIISFNPHNPLRWMPLIFYTINKNAEAQKNSVTCCTCIYLSPKSHLILSHSLFSKATIDSFALGGFRSFWISEETSPACNFIIFMFP